GLATAPLVATQRHAHAAKARIDFVSSDATDDCGLAVMTATQWKLREETNDRQTRPAQRRRTCRLGRRPRLDQGFGTRHSDPALRQRRAAAGQISAEAADDRPHQPAAAARDAVCG